MKHWLTSQRIGMIPAGNCDLHLLRVGGRRDAGRDVARLRSRRADDPEAQRAVLGGFREGGMVHAKGIISRREIDTYHFSLVSPRNFFEYSSVDIPQVFWTITPIEIN